MYHLVSHVFHQNGLPIYGHINVLEKFLKDKGVKYNLVSLPLALSGQYRVEYTNFEESSLKHHSNLLIKGFFDLYFLLKYFFKVRIKSEDVVIAVDPLNNFIFGLFKPFIGYKLIYYTADYSDNRFNSKLLNLIYGILDKYSVKVSDQNWCVSSKIVEKRQSQGFHNNIFFLPNTPILPFPPSIQMDNKKNRLIYVGRMDENMNLLKILKAIVLLRKSNNLISLTLVGGGQLENRIVRLIQARKLKSYIHYLGPLKNDKVVENITKCGIGLALYSGGNSWNMYGDSMKLREYQYFGLPVITTEIPSNSSEIIEYNCGIVLNQDNFNQIDLIKSILTIQNSYNIYTENTLKLAKNRDKDKTLERLLKL